MPYILFTPTIISKHTLTSFKNIVKFFNRLKLFKFDTEVSYVTKCNMITNNIFKKSVELIFLYKKLEFVGFTMITTRFRNIILSHY